MAGLRFDDQISIRRFPVYFCLEAAITFARDVDIQKSDDSIILVFTGEFHSWVDLIEDFVESFEWVFVGGGAPKSEMSRRLASEDYPTVVHVDL